MSTRKPNSQRVATRRQLEMPRGNEHDSASSSVAVRAAAIVFLIAAVGLAYGGAIRAPFLFDDQYTIVENESIVHLWPLVGVTNSGPLNPPQFTPTAGRPLVNLSLAVNYFLGGLNSSGYHVFNLCFHILSALLLAAIVDRTLRLQHFAGRFAAATAPLSFAVALLWALHPLQSESILYVTQRTELMMAFFYLATIYCSLRYWQAATPLARRLWLVLAAAACFAGMTSKEVMVSAPVMVLLYDRTFMSESFRDALRKSWPLYLGLAAGWLVLLALNYGGPRSDSAGFHLGVPAGTWWFTQARVFWMYLTLALWPSPLIIHYDIPYLTTFSAAWTYVVPLVALVIATFILLARRNTLGYLAAWVLAILSPTMLVPITTEVAAERRMYLPLVAIVTLVVVGGYALLRWQGMRGAAASDSKSLGPWPLAAMLLIAGVLTFAAGIATATRAAAFENGVTLWQDVLAHQPANAVAHQNLAVALMTAGQLQSAIEHFREAARLKPDDLSARYGLALALLNTGHTNDAIHEFQQAERLKPEAQKIRNNLGVALFSAGRFEEAADVFRESLRLSPDEWETRDNLGNALQHAGRLPEAIEQFEEAARLQPAAADVFAHLALAHAENHESAKAVEAARHSVAIAREEGQAAVAQRMESWLAKYLASPEGRSAHQTDDNSTDVTH